MRIPIDGLTVGRQPHDLVLAGIDPEAGIIGEGGIEKPQGMRKTYLLLDLNLLPRPTQQLVVHSPTPSMVRMAASGMATGKRRSRHATRDVR